MNEEQRVYVEEILDALKDSYFEELSSNSYCQDVIDSFIVNYKHKQKFTWEAGATKLVLIFKELGFVIKIPFVMDGEWDGEYLCGAENKYGDSWNYCQTELEKFQLAQTKNLRDAFVRVECVGYVHEHPIYFQELAKILCDCGSHSSKEEAEKMWNYCQSHSISCFDRYWLNDAFNFYGEEKFYKLLNFIDDASIDDLHPENIGYIEMRPVLIDYSGWNN